MQVFTFNSHLIHLFVTTFLTPFLKVFNLQGKDASKSAGNWFQFIMVLFTNEYLPICSPNKKIIKYFWGTSQCALLHCQRNERRLTINQISVLQLLPCSVYIFSGSEIENRFERVSFSISVSTAVRGIFWEVRMLQQNQ
jgi:hypothetical protein